MRLAGFTLALAVCFAGSALAQPSVTSLENIYSWTLPGLPNYGIAQGSIFAIFGANLASTTVPLQPPPLQTTLSGVTVNVTVGGTTTQALLYYLSPTQINAVLPSATPVGTGTITVTNGAGTSADFPIIVLKNGFGLLTWNYGNGPVQGYNASDGYVLMNQLAATNPGDVLELWGTGLGPVQGDATLVNAGDSVEVDIGGVKAQLNYAGRSGFTGLDQINVVVPAGVSGCNASVVVKSGNIYSNFGTLPVVASGRTCSDPTIPFSADLLAKIAQTGSISIGVVGISQTTTQGTTVGGITVGGGTTDSGHADFIKFTYAEFIEGASYSGFATSIGSCAVSFFKTSTNNPNPPQPFQFTYLNAGNDVNINGPNGLIAMPLTTTNGIEFYSTPSSVPSFIPASGGTFTFDNGSGGPDVGGFSTQLQISAPFTWTNMNSISMVSRASGLGVNWTGGDPGTFVNITGLSFGAVNGSSTDFVAGSFTCQAPTSAGSFTVPAAVLQSMPPSATIAGISFSTLSLSNDTNPVTFSATGLDIGWAS